MLSATLIGLQSPEVQIFQIPYGVNQFQGIRPRSHTATSGTNIDFDEHIYVGIEGPGDGIEISGILPIVETGHQLGLTGQGRQAS